MQALASWTSAEGYQVSTDLARLDLHRIHRFLTTSYWSPGIPFDIVARAVTNSLPFGLYAPDGSQVGFARTVTDFATYAYLADVYVEGEHRGKGLGKFLIDCVVSEPRLQNLRRWALATADAHGLYARHGFRSSPTPETHMFLERSASQLWPDRPSERTESGCAANPFAP
jgi:GNAT superfamily N-acetyltransferase